MSPINTRMIRTLHACLSLLLLSSSALFAKTHIADADRQKAKAAYAQKWEARQKAKPVQAKVKAKYTAPVVESENKHHVSHHGRTCSKKKCVNAENICTDSITVKKNAFVQGDLAASGNATFGGSMYVKGNTVLQHNLLIKGDETVRGDETVDGNLTVGGQISAPTISADRLDVNVETTNVSYEDVNVIEDLRYWQTERFVTPDYDRFPNGILPPTTKLGPGEVYSYTSLKPTFVPIEGNDWNATTHGIINFSSATAQEKLDYYSGAFCYLWNQMLDSPFSANENLLKVGNMNGWGLTLNGTVMPKDQQQYAADALNTILNGLLTIDPNDLTGQNRITYFNLITMARYSIIAWSAGNTNLNLLGVEYFGLINPANLANYYYAAAFYPSGFLNVSIIPAYEISNDGPALLPYVRALPGLYKLYPALLQNQLDIALTGMKEGYYPHVLRNRPYSSAGQSTFGELEYGYTPEIAQLVATGEFPAFDDPYLSAKQDYDLLVNATFEDQISPDLLFSTDGGIIAGFNPILMLEMLVEQGVMSQTEADYLQEVARQNYDTVVKPALLNWYETLYFNEDSPFVRALRMTRYDDYPGEWGYKFKVDANGNVEALVTAGPHTGETVYVDTLGDDLVIMDSNGDPVNVSLKDVTLQRDEAAGNEHYTNMAEIVLRLNRDTPIPYYKKVSNTPGVNPFENWEVQFDNSSASLPVKLHEAGSSLVAFFDESINYYLDLWVTQSFPPLNTPKVWQDFFATREEAIQAIIKAGRLTGDLEDPANGGIYAFVQHYKPIEDDNGPLYDFSQIEAYYTDAWDGVPQLKLTPGGRVDGPAVKDRDGNVIYDPEAPLGPDGLINLDALFALSQVDNDKADYYRFLTSVEIAQGKSARVYYFFYDFIKHSFEDYMTMGNNPLLNFYFSPYIKDAFDKVLPHRYLNSSYASGASYNPLTELITFTHLINYPDPRNSTIGDRTTLLHEFIMGHAVQIPLTQMINSTGTGAWLTGYISNPATAEGWAVFIETFFGPAYTSYLSPVDRYWNATDPEGRPDPVTIVPSLIDTARVAARLKWDTALHSSDFKASMAEHAAGFEADTFGNFPITSEISQRVPVGPTQGLNYGLGFLQIIGLYQNLPNALGQAKYDALQADGFKATKYFFDLLLLDAQGYFISSLQPLYDAWALKVKNGVPPFDNPNYDGYPVDAFDAHTVPYVPGSRASVYEYSDNPYVPGGFTFEFTECPVPNTGVCPTP